MAKVNYIALNDSLRPINKNTVKSIERNSAQFIYVNRDRVAKCERCESEFTLADAKHNSFAKCPKCHRTYKVIHTWRKSKNESIHWEVVATKLTDTTLALRYYLVERMDGKIIDSNERARLFVNTDKKEVCKFENSTWDEGWKKTGRRFFKEFHMCYQTNRYFCLGADVRDSFFEVVKTVPKFKYFDLKSVWENGFYASDICYISKRIDLYEKLQKLGLGKLVSADLNAYSSREIKYDNTKTELTKMLGINKNGLNLLKIAPTLKAVRLLQSTPNINEREFMAFKNFDKWEIDHLATISKKIATTTYKIANYLTSQGAGVYEYEKYISKLEENNYDVKDRHYSMPKDMAKEMARLVEEENRAKAEFEAKKNELIKAVHDKLTANEELREFFKGAKGFMAYVPMSEEDFIAEGKAQHNCVGRGHYADAVAKEETLVFFIREVGNPTAPFVTMEYCNGVIVQCMLNHNERVKEDTKVYNFCSALADKLNKCNILSA